MSQAMVSPASASSRIAAIAVSAWVSVLPSETFWFRIELWAAREAGRAMASAAAPRTSFLIALA
jgi:hypothetical protein